MQKWAFNVQAEQLLCTACSSIAMPLRSCCFMPAFMACSTTAPLLRLAGVPIPTQPSPGAAAAEMSRAALHDPFAALTGLPPKSSPGSTGGVWGVWLAVMYCAQPLPLCLQQDGSACVCKRGLLPMHDEWLLILWLVLATKLLWIVIVSFVPSICGLQAPARRRLGIIRGTDD